MHHFLECTSSRHKPWTQCAACCWRKHMRPLSMQVSTFYVTLWLENDLGFLEEWYILRPTVWADEVCCMSVVEMKDTEVCHLIPLRQLHQYHILTAYLSEINFYIIFPFIILSSDLTFLFWYLYKKDLCTFCFSYAWWACVVVWH